MNSRKISLVLAAVLFVAATGATGLINSVDDDAYFKKIKYSVKQVSDKWKVVDERNQAKPIEADANDDVEWTAEGSDMVFQFPAEIGPYLSKVEGEYDDENFTASVANGKKLTLKIKGDAPKGSYTYSVYVKGGDTYAEGSSPPVIIIGGS